MNRKYQDMVARFNVYFNGTERLRKATEALQAAHKDDYSEVLEIYNYGSTESKKSKSGEMDEIIKKASKIIADRPLSKWVDDAYLLMGQAYYYKGDYFAAIETFQYINTKYKGKPISYEATLWIIRAYIRLDKEREAEAIIGLMNNDAAFPESLKQLLYEVSAAVYVKEGKYKSAAENLEKLMEKRVRPASKRYRYRYILAQLYDRLGERKKAREYYELVTKGSPPYEMAFNAKINLARNYDPSNEAEVRQAKRHLRSMLRDDKNISYFDQIYYELGLIEKAENDREQALQYLRQSNNYNKNNQDQRALTHLALADIYFDIPDYKQAQLYYDSAVFFLTPEFENYDKLKAKQEVLSELIKSLIVIHREDSLLKLSYLDPKALDKKIEQAIEAEKERERKKKEEEERRKNQPQNGNPMVPGNPFQQQAQTPAGSGFYFDDPTNVARGYSEFLNRWGRRNNTDLWQFSAAAREQEIQNNQKEGKGDGEGEQETGEKGKEDNLGLPDSISPDKALYYKDIPFTEEARKNALNRIALAYLDAGVIYFEQLKELEEARAKFMKFRERFADHEEDPKALYYLYKIYSEQENAQKADENKALLISKYPDSKYAKFLSQGGGDTEVQDPGEDKEATALYQKAYDAYKKGNYQEVFRQKKAHDKDYFGSRLQPKFELLKAITFAQLDSTDATIEALESLLRNYPTAAEALTAQRMLNAYKKQKSEKEVEAPDTTGGEPSVKYAFSPESKHYFLLLLPESKAKLNVNLIKSRISDFNKRNASGKSYAVDDIVVGDRQFVLVKQFENQEEAANYLDLVKSNNSLLPSLGIPGNQLFIMDAKNVGLMVVNSDLEGFRNFYREYYGK